jgi:hypothetical protein
VPKSLLPVKLHERKGFVIWLRDIFQHIPVTAFRTCEVAAVVINRGLDLSELEAGLTLFAGNHD